MAPQGRQWRGPHHPRGGDIACRAFPSPRRARDQRHVWRIGDAQGDDQRYDANAERHHQRQRQEDRGQSPDHIEDAEYQE